MVRTPPFQGENPGSNPSGAAKNQKTPPCVVFFNSFDVPGVEPRFTMSETNGVRVPTARMTKPEW